MALYSCEIKKTYTAMACDTQNGKVAEARAEAEAAADEAATRENKADKDDRLRTKVPTDVTTAVSSWK